MITEIIDIIGIVRKFW